MPWNARSGTHREPPESAKVGIPGDKLAYVEVAGDAADRKVGFGSR